MRHFQVISFAHTHLPIDLIGKLYTEGEEAKALHQKVLDGGAEEVKVLNTCNRVEIYSYGEKVLDKDSILEEFFPNLAQADKETVKAGIQYFRGEEAVKHLFSVASSVKSMVIGEREILTQVRKAFEQSDKWGFTGDNLRLLVRSAVETAKRVYTETSIATRPVSVVYLAFERLMQQGFDPKTAKVLMVGAGTTNRTMARFMTKKGFSNFAIYNRSEEGAKDLVEITGGSFTPLSALASHSAEFEVLVTCTGASEPIITEKIFNQISGEGRKVIIDLAVPADVDPVLVERLNATDNIIYIGMNELKAISEENLRIRAGEVEKAEKIFESALVEADKLLRIRKVEKRMTDVPSTIKNIRQTAVEKIYADKLNGLDADSRALMDEILDYMEKKYISLPMKMAKEILVEDPE